MHRIRLGTLSLQSKRAPFPSTVSLFSVRFSPGSISAERLEQALDVGRIKGGSGIAARGQPSYDEAVAAAGDLSFERGHELMKLFLG